ncbi:MAG: hypothetical protein ABII09_09950 [Planctomycetota bacterium]
MIGDLLDKIVSDGKETIDSLMKVLPFIVIGGLWLLGAIVKTVQASKKGQLPQRQQKTKVGKRQPENLADFIRIVKEQYASARAQTMKVADQASEKVSEIRQTISWPDEESFNKPPMLEVTTPAPQPVVEKQSPEGQPPVLEPASFVPGQIALTRDYLTNANESAAASETSRANPYLKEISIQFANPDNLRKVIIYSEILRPPLALRE